MLERRSDQARNRRPLIEAGDHCRAGRRSKHVSSLRQVPPGIESKPLRAGGSSGIGNPTKMVHVPLTPDL
jgi:hypothetical protein